MTKEVGMRVEEKDAWREEGVNERSGGRRLGKVKVIPSRKERKGGGRGESSGS